VCDLHRVPHSRAQKQPAGTWRSCGGCSRGCVWSRPKTLARHSPARGRMKARKLIRDEAATHRHITFDNGGACGNRGPTSVDFADLLRSETVCRGWRGQAQSTTGLYIICLLSSYRRLLPEKINQQRRHAQIDRAPSSARVPSKKATLLSSRRRNGRSPRRCVKLRLARPMNQARSGVKWLEC